MSFLVIIILSIVQGVTEFLPISSSGHLVLLYNFFGIKNNTQLLSIRLHISTLLSVVIYYRKEILVLIRNPLCPTNRKIFLTTIVTCVVVLLIKPLIDKAFDGQLLFVFFIITALLLLISDYVTEKHAFVTRTRNLSEFKTTHHFNTNITHMDINYKQAIVIGIAQAIACIPGISRSGSTIAIAKICGVKNDSAQYSFLISIPIIIASFVLEIVDNKSLLLDTNILGLICGMIVCLFIGLACIKFMTRLVKNNRLIYFSYYLIALSTILVVFMFIL